MSKRDESGGKICKREPIPGIRKLHRKMENLQLTTTKLPEKMAGIAGSRMMSVKVRV